jgi:hypothetical protein
MVQKLPVTTEKVKEVVKIAIKGGKYRGTLLHSLSSVFWSIVAVVWYGHSGLVSAEKEHRWDN